MVAKTTSFLYFCYKLLHDFWFLHDFGLMNLCLMFFDQNDLYLTFKFKMVTANTLIKACFIIFYHKQHLFNGKLNIDYVKRQIGLQGIRNCV